MSDSMLYGFGSIAQSSSAVQAFVARTNNELSEVDNAFKQLIALGWSGPAADSFQALSTRWHTLANEMAATINTLGVKVGTAGEDMHAADQWAASQFG
jgi:WXG100 family type VII secretion target